MKMLTLIETLEIKLADALNAANEFEAMGLQDSAEQWWLVAGVLSSIISEEKGN